MALTAVITEVGKRRIAELMAGFVTGPFSPSGVSQAVRPVFFQVWTGGQTSGKQHPPAPTRTELEAPALQRLQKSLVGPVAFGNDINVSIPPASPEATIEFKLIMTAVENNLGAGITIAELGIFVQFGVPSVFNPPTLFVYGTFPPFLSDGSTAFEFHENAKI